MADPSFRLSVRLFMRKKAVEDSGSKQTEEEETPQFGPETPYLSKTALRMRKYRERMKEQGTYRDYRTKENENIRQKKKSRTEEELAADREKARLRVKKWRETQRELGRPIKTSKTPKTRAGQELKRAQDRLRQQKYREGLSSQKKAAINMKRRKRREMLRVVENLHTSQPQVEQASSGFGYAKINTQHKAVKKVKACLPSSPSKYAAVVESLTKTKSPLKKAALVARGVVVELAARRKLDLSRAVHGQVVEEVLKLKKSRRKKDVAKKAALCHLITKSAKKRGELSCFRQEVGCSLNFLHKAASDEALPCKKRPDALLDTVCSSIKDFYNRGDISREDPSASSVSAKTHESKRYMEKTLLEAHREFMAESGINVSFAKFAALRPERTKTAGHIKLNTCMCEYCANVGLKIHAVNSVLHSKGHRDKLLGSKHDLSNCTLCVRAENGVHSKACLDRECPSCGVQKLRQRLQVPLDEFPDAKVSWKMWALIPQTYTDREGNVVNCSRKGLTQKEGPFDQLITELEEDLKNFSLHLENAWWQHKQFYNLKANLPDKWLLIVMDFGENLTCHYQNEAQGAHWGRQQITIHPCVTFYKCPDDGETMRESFMFVSPDLKHDCHAVQHFQLEVTAELRQRGMHFDRVVHFSDGCAGQYKGKTNFVDCSLSAEDTGIMTEKHYFGSRHGKGPCDAEIGTLKRLAGLAVKRNQAVIASANDLFDYASGSLTRPSTAGEHCHAKRTFKLVPVGAIQRNRPERTGPDVKGIKGSRSIHCVRGSMPFLVATRERSCFCDECLSGGGYCHFEEFCGPWKPETLQKGVRLKQHGAEPRASQPPLPELPDVPHPPPAELPEAPQPPPAQLPKAPQPPPPQLPEAPQPPPAHLPKSPQPPPVQLPGAPQPPPAELPDAPQSSELSAPQLQCGMWVRAAFSAGKKKIPLYFIGTILETNGAEVLVKFLRIHETYYTFPHVEDISWVSVEDVTVLDPPTINARGQHFF